MNGRKNPVLLIFGYPFNFHFGGLVWIKKVADYIEKNDLFSVRKVSSYVDPKKHALQHIVHLRAVLEGCFTNPNLAILDTYGEATLLMGILLRVFKPSAKIVTVFHHYEPLSVKHRKARLFTKIYCKIVDYFTKIMLNDSDKVLTVSISSSCQLEKLLTIPNRNKTVVVGCSSSDKLPPIQTSAKRDLDFLCVGRFEKFDGIENIWNIIRKVNPKSKFVGRVSSRDVTRLHNIGIDHKKIVSEEEKLQLFSRAKVFIFPSIFEGFGMAVTEAQEAGLSVVAWCLPVFEERFGGKESGNKIKLVKIGETIQFAQEAVTVLKDWHERHRSESTKQGHFKTTKTWEEVGRDVICVSKQIIINSIENEIS
jgi:glycosyltransferase involved in cell wall biosynthesis